jgi:hypothetical protein
MTFADVLNDAHKHFRAEFALEHRGASSFAEFPAAGVAFEEPGVIRKFFGVSGSQGRVCRDLGIGGRGRLEFGLGVRNYSIPRPLISARAGINLWVLEHHMIHGSPTASRVF